MKNALIVLVVLGLAVTIVAVRIQQERNASPAVPPASPVADGGTTDGSGSAESSVPPSSTTIAAPGPVAEDARQSARHASGGSQDAVEQAREALREAEARYRKAREAGDPAAELASALETVESALAVLAKEPGTAAVRKLRRQGGLLRSDIVRVSGF